MTARPPFMVTMTDGRTDSGAADQAPRQRACYVPDLRHARAAMMSVYTEICILKIMKTTLDLNDQLLANAKALAAQQRTSLTRLIEEGLQLRLRASTTEPSKVRRRLPVFNGRGGLVAGVNPLSNKAMLDALDDDA